MYKYLCFGESDGDVRVFLSENLSILSSLTKKNVDKGCQLISGAAQSIMFLILKFSGNNTVKRFYG